MEKPGLPKQIFKSILYGRFEPIETIIATFLIVQGVWVTVREGFEETTFLFSKGWSFKLIAMTFAILGIIHLVSMWKTPFRKGDARWWKWRCHSMFSFTLVLMFAALEVFFKTPPGETRFLIWIALTLISATTYLSLVVKR